MRHHVSKQDSHWEMKLSRMLFPLYANKPTSTTHCTKAWASYSELSNFNAEPHTTGS